MPHSYLSTVRHSDIMVTTSDRGQARQGLPMSLPGLWPGARRQRRARAGSVDSRVIAQRDRRVRDLGRTRDRPLFGAAVTQAAAGAPPAFRRWVSPNPPMSGVRHGPG